MNKRTRQMAKARRMMGLAKSKWSFARQIREAFANIAKSAVVAVCGFDRLAAVAEAMHAYRIADEKKEREKYERPRRNAAPAE